MNKFNLLVCLFLGLVLCSANAEAAGPKKIAKSYLNELMAEDYEKSYDYFSDQLKGNISREQHVSFMQLLKDKFGKIRKYKECKMPIIGNLLLDEDMFKFSKSRNYNYCLDYENGSILAKIGMEKINSTWQINSFNLILEEAPKEFEKKAAVLGIKEGDPSF